MTVSQGVLRPVCLGAAALAVSATASVLLFLTGCNTTNVAYRSILPEFGPNRYAPLETAEALPATSTSGERYAPIERNRFRSPYSEPLSTFSVDVDTASYSNARRFIVQQGALPPPDAVRIEEMLNYFGYAYPQPTGAHPLALHADVAEAPWAPQHRLVRIGLQAEGMDAIEDAAPANFVFLVDVSGSMRASNKLPVVKHALRTFVSTLRAEDRVAVVTYADDVAVRLPSTPARRESAIQAAIAELRANGSTNASGGIEQAYAVARQSFAEGGENRIILCSDGDFNVGTTNPDELAAIVQEQAEDGIFLTVAGFGMGNLRDDMLEELSNRGNGTYAYIDSLDEADRVFGERIGAFTTVAQDVKAMVEFNPAQVQAYRLIGYENRLLTEAQFHDDGEDAGDVGAGHSVTVLYEVVPYGVELPQGTTGDVHYQQAPWNNASTLNGELLTVKVRYKEPGSRSSQQIESVLADQGQPLHASGADFQFAAAVAGWGMLLAGDAPAHGDLSYNSVLQLATNGAVRDPDGQRAAFVDLVRRSQAIAGERATSTEYPAISLLERR